MARPNIGLLTRSLSRCYSTTHSTPRHLLTVADLTPSELKTLVQNAASYKAALKTGKRDEPLRSALRNQTIGVTFSKRSTRTRVSVEGAVVALGGHPIFLGKDDIQLGVNESLRDTSVIISSMVSGIIARVGPHRDVVGLAEYSSVPVINALSDLYHPMQTLADLLTIFESCGNGRTTQGLQGLKIAWIGDANNVLFDLAIGSAKLGVDVAVATPEGYGIPENIRTVIKQAADSAKQPGGLMETTVPQDAIKGADVIVTDTWVSMGQEEEKSKRLRAFAGYQVTNKMVESGGAKSGWKFMHCMPRHAEEVDDEVFYGPHSLVFQEGENRLWTAIAAIDAFVVKRGKIGDA